MKRLLTLKLLLALALVSAAGRCPALELSLEENRGESGSVGYVDIEKVFREYPETLRAKEAFKAELERKEKTIFDRKKEIFALRGDISRMKLEREFTLRLSSGPLSAPLPAEPAAAVSTVAVSTQSLDFPIVDTMSVAPSTFAATGEEVAFSSNPMSPVLALDYKIAKAQEKLAFLEANFKQFQSGAEKEMVAFENRKTEIILGKIYYALRELSVEESLSVVVDKKSILYGQKAVDLTDKLLRKLRGY